MLHPMERKIGKYDITISGFIFDWSWHLLPSLSVSFDEVGVYIAFDFLCFDVNMDIENRVKAAQWEARLNEKMQVFNPYDHD